MNKEIIFLLIQHQVLTQEQIKTIYKVYRDDEEILVFLTDYQNLSKAIIKSILNTIYGDDIFYYARDITWHILEKQKLDSNIIDNVIDNQYYSLDIFNHKLSYDQVDRLIWNAIYVNEEGDEAVYVADTWGVDFLEYIYNNLATPDQKEVIDKTGIFN